LEKKAFQFASKKMTIQQPYPQSQLITIRMDNNGANTTDMNETVTATTTQQPMKVLCPYELVVFVVLVVYDFVVSFQWIHSGIFHTAMIKLIVSFVTFASLKEEKTKRLMGVVTGVYVCGFLFTIQDMVYRSNFSYYRRLGNTWVVTLILELILAVLCVIFMIRDPRKHNHSQDYN
jgi:hypothetical protein